MVREVILAMKPGKKLDCIVARKIMEWKAVPYPHCRGAEYWQNVQGRVTNSIYGWNPSTDISSAWEVVKKFPYFLIYTFGDGNFACTMTADKDKLDAHWGTAYGKVATEVICKAALLSKLEGEITNE